jgi:hypothetical protein
MYDGDINGPTPSSSPLPGTSETSPKPVGTDPTGPTYDSNVAGPPPSSSPDSGTPGLNGPSATGAAIITEQAGSGDDTGLLSACSNHPPETSSNMEIRVLAFEYVMLVVPETVNLYVEALVSEVEDRLHEGLANELLQCIFSADARAQRLAGEQDEFKFLSILSLPKDFLTSADCADDEKRDNTDCLVIAGIFTLEILKGGSFDDLLAGLTRLMKEFMPPNIRRELTENLSVADIDLNLKGLFFRRFIDDFNYMAAADPNVDGAEQPEVGSSQSKGAATGAAIAGTVAALAIVVGFLAMQRRRSRRFRDQDGETTTIGIRPRPADTSLPDIYDTHDNTMYDLRVYTTLDMRPVSECGDSENGVSDTEEPHNPITCASVPEKSFDSAELYDQFDVDSALTRKVFFSRNSIGLETIAI